MGSRAFLASFTGGETIPLDDVKQLNNAEDLLAHHFLPYTDLSPKLQAAAERTDYLWGVRHPLDRDIREPTFHGMLHDVTLTRISDAYELLLDYNSTPLRRRNPDEARASVIGFMVGAALASTSGGQLGSSERPVWLIRPTDPTLCQTGPWRRVIGHETGENVALQAHLAIVRRSTSQTYQSRTR